MCCLTKSSLNRGSTLLIYWILLFIIQELIWNFLFHFISYWNSKVLFLTLCSKLLSKYFSIANNIFDIQAAYYAFTIVCLIVYFHLHSTFWTKIAIFHNIVAFHYYLPKRYDMLAFFPNIMYEYKLTSITCFTNKKLI